MRVKSLMVSYGPLKQAADAKAERTTEGDMLFRWSNNEGDGNAKGDDKVIFLAYDEEHEIPLYNTEYLDRSDEMGVLQIPDYFKERALHVFLVLMSGDEKRFSMSEYLGEI